MTAIAEAPARRSADGCASRHDSIVVHGLTKSYGAGAAVEELSLEIASGEFVTLLGPSGSGKTTTLLMIAGLIAPDRGRIYIAGHDVTYAAPHRRNIGIVFQNYALFPHLTVYDNIAFPLRVRRLGRREVDDRVRDMLDRLQLGGLELRLPNQLSGGQQQRVALARALVFEPSLLLMDEPLAAIDRKLRQRMQLEIKQLQRSLSIPVLYVTHDQEEALVMSDRIAVMNHGRLEQLGTVSHLYDRPASRFVAEFLGEANLLHARVETVSNGSRQMTVRVADAWLLKGTASDVMAVGADVLAAVRPERIEFAEEAVTSSDTNTVDGEIEETIFAGDVLKFLVRLPTGSRMLVKALNRERARKRHRGTTVRLAWSAADTRVVPREPARHLKGEKHV